MEWIELTIKTTSAAIDLVCDRLTVLNFGELLAEGDCASVLRDPEVVRAYLGA